MYLKIKVTSKYVNMDKIEQITRMRHQVNKALVSSRRQYSKDRDQAQQMAERDSAIKGVESAKIR
jgi:hypothetical protein